MHSSAFYPTSLKSNPIYSCLFCSNLSAQLHSKPTPPNPIYFSLSCLFHSPSTSLPSDSLHSLLLYYTLSSRLHSTRRLRSTLFCSVLLCSALLSTPLHSILFCSLLFYSARLCCTLPYCTSLHYNLLNSDILCFFLPHSCPLSYNTTQYNTIYTQYTQFSRTNIQKKSLSRIGVRLWNKIPEDLRKIKISFIQQFR